MSKCPYCLAEIPDEAVKCMHCGEWVEEPPDESTDRRRGRFGAGGDPSLGRAANRFVTFSIVMAVIGLVLALIFFFGLFLPSWKKSHRDFEKRWNEGPALPRPR